MKPQQQYQIPFEAAQQELLAQIRLLRNIDLGLSPGRAEGVIQLLERLALLTNDATERGGRVVVRAQVVAIAARVKGYRTACERTVRNWRRDAEDLGIVDTDHRSRKYGGTAWNVYTLRIDQIRELIRQHNAPIPAPMQGPATGGNGRQRAATVSDPGAEMISDPGAEMISDLTKAVTHTETHSSSCSLDRSARPSTSTARRGPLEEIEEEGEVGECFFPDLVDRARSFGVYSADSVTRAISRAGADHVAAILDHYDAARWGPGALCVRLQRAHAALKPADGWPPPAKAEPVPKRRQDPGLDAELARARRLRAARMRSHVETPS